MSEPFIGQIMMFGSNFAIRGWAFCDGQLLPIAQHTALFSILGTTYGGDGRTTFGMPNLKGRVAMHPGNGPGLSQRRLGHSGGSSTATMTVQTMPSHQHSATLKALADDGSTGDPGGGYAANSSNNNYAESSSGVGGTNPTSATGNGQPFNIMSPSLGVNYLIALQGTYPSRN